MDSNKQQAISKAKEEQIVDQKGATYRIDRNSLLYRDSQMNAIYLCYKHTKHHHQRQLVSIKEYSQNMNPVQIIKEWDVLKNIQKLKSQPLYNDFFTEFITTKTKRYYLVMKEFKQTLMDKHQFGCKNMKIEALNKIIKNFTTNVSSLLLVLQKMPKNNSLILTTLKPHYLVCNEQNNFILTNFSNALVVSQKQKMIKFEKIRGEGLHYYAPQMLQDQICSKSNVWMFGCMLFQILCNGQKLIESEDYYSRTKGEAVSKYIKKRIEYCQFRFNKLNDQNIQVTNSWIQLVQLCLLTNVSLRLSIEQLHKRVTVLQYKNNFLIIDQSILQARILQQLAFQYFRANLLQSKIFAIFDQIYKMEGNESKYVIYIIIKFAAFIFLQNYHLSKERAEVFAKKENASNLNKSGNLKHFQEKYGLFLALSEHKKIKDIKDKITQKIQKLMQIQKRQYEYYIFNKNEFQDESNIQHKQKVREDIKRCFVQYQDRKVYDAQNILFAFCNKYAREIEQNKAIAIMIAEILQYSKEFIDIADLNQQQKNQKSSISVLSLKNVYKFFEKCQQQAYKNPRQVFSNCYQNAEKINRRLPQRINY